jgi:WD40 repeat protein
MGPVHIWDAVSGQQRIALRGHTSLVTAVAIAPDGTWLATTSLNGSVRI